MPYAPSPIGSSEGANGTPNNQENHNSPHEVLEREFLSRLGQSTDHSFSTAPAFIRWKNFWHEKMFLLWHVAEGKSWSEIVEWFDKIGIVKDNDALYSLWQRVSVEAKAMVRAAEFDKSGEELRLISDYLDHTLTEAAKLDADGVWERISFLMPYYGSVEKWTAEKVKYAWFHGISRFGPQIGSPSFEQI